MLITLLQTIGHQDTFEVLIVFFGVIAVSCFLIFMHNDLRDRAEPICDVDLYASLAPSGPAIIDYPQRYLIALVHMFLPLPLFSLPIRRSHVSPYSDDQSIAGFQGIFVP